MSIKDDNRYICIEWKYLVSWLFGAYFSVISFWLRDQARHWSELSLGVRNLLKVYYATYSGKLFLIPALWRQRSGSL